MAVRSKKSPPPGYLAGWKEIATYLGKGVRTVQRYEREMSLPIRRPAGRSRAAVVATHAELDAWVGASPYRDAFSLTRLAMEYPAPTVSLARTVAEMAQLRGQMVALRNELIKSVDILRDSIRTVHDGVNDSWRNRKPSSVERCEANDKLISGLLKTRAATKVN